jgi:predicted metal-dependent hydrolase
VHREAGTLVVTVAGDPGPERVQALVEGWYAAEARAVLPERVAECWARFAAPGETCPSVRIRTMTSRWGSLAGGARMTLNAHLMRVPPRAVDYLIYHELCHLRVRGHGADFYRELAAYVPDHRAIRAEMRARRTVPPGDAV